MLRKSVAVVLLLIGSTLAFAVPSIDEVYQVAKSGKLSEAKTMIQSVLQEHPNDPRAHYIYAQLLARGGDYATAATELTKAETLAPGLPFANANSVNQLRTVLSQHIHDPALLPAIPHSQMGGIGWSWLLWLAGGVVVVILIGRVMSRTNQQTSLSSQYQLPNTGAAQPNPGMAPPYGQAPTGNSALKTGLATGLGVAAGMVAGQAIANTLFGDHHNDQIPNQDIPSGNNDLGGQDFGLNDTSAWNDGASSDSGIDFGDSGGGDWS